MKHTIKIELEKYIIDRISEYDIETRDKLIRDGDLHHELFNTDYYIIGYYKAQQWLDEHGISVFEALETIREYEDENFGESKHYTNAEETVNMLVYIYGVELMYKMELI